MGIPFKVGTKLVVRYETPEWKFKENVARNATSEGLATLCYSYPPLLV